MTYSSNASGGYGCGSGYCCRHAEPNENYGSSRKQKSVKVLGCTCGGVGPCKGTCRLPVPE